MRKRKREEIADFDLIEELEYLDKPQKRRGIPAKFVIGFLLLMILIAGVLFSPLFAVQEILSQGTERFTTGQLAEMISLSQGDNLVLFSKSKAEKTLEQDPYIADAKLSKSLPHSITIQVTERKARGYVPYMGAYLYIDEEGRVLETQSAFYETLPVVRGLRFDSFVLGEVLPAENKEALLAVLQMSQMMKKYNLLDLVLEIDVSDTEDIYAYVNHVEIRLGSMHDSDQKIRILGEIVKTIPEEDRGSLDLRDLSKPIIFRYLT